MSEACEKSLDFTNLRQIRLKGLAAAFRRRPLGLLRRAAIVNGHVSARPPQLQRDGSANAPRRPGDEDNLAFDRFRHSSLLSQLPR
jgi:hypothetical protein